MTVKESFTSKNFKIGSYSTLISAAVLAIIVVINLFVSALPSSVTKLDVSSNSMYSISDESKEIVKNINESVTVYFLAETGTEDNTVYELIGRYLSLNSNIKLKRVDPGINPNFFKEYTEDAPSSSSLIFESARRSIVIDYAELFPVSYTEEEMMNYYYYGVTPVGTTSFAGESKITGALDYVTSEMIPKLYTLTGHGEAAISETLASYISDDNIIMEELSLLTSEEVPADANCVVINAPTSDLSQDDVKKLNAYIDRGGNVILLTLYQEPVLGNISDFAGAYGAQYIDGMIVEGNANYYLSGYPYMLLPKIQSSPLTATLDTSSLYVLLPQVHGIKKADTMPEGVSYTSLLTTSGAAYAKLDAYNLSSLEKADEDAVGPFDLGAVMEKSATGGKLIWITGAPMLEQSIDAAVSGGNSTYILTMLNSLCDKGISVSIAAKSMQMASLVIDEFSGNLWGAVITVIIPAAIVVGGLVYWMRRRKR